jgi:hypothetical protein
MDSSFNPDAEFFPERGGSGDGLQAFSSHYKYTDEITAVVAKPACEVRIYPDIDPATGEIRPSIEGNRLTWVEYEYGADYVGIKFPALKLKKNFAFWIVPSDMHTLPGFKEKMDALVTEKDRMGFQIKNSPYYYIFKRLQDSAHDLKAPEEWALMSSRKKWMEFLGVSSNLDAPPPVPRPELHAIVRGQLITNKGTPYDETTYEDGRSPGSLHPVVIELKKTATDEFKSDGFLAMAQRAFQEQGVQFSYDAIVDPKAGYVIKIEMRQITQEMGSTINVHKFSLRGAYQKPVTPEELKAEWRPWREPVEVGGKMLAPILKYISCEDHIGILIQAYGPELVAYCMRGTPYFDLIPANNQDAFDKFTETYPNAPIRTWYTAMAERAQLQSSSSPQRAAAAPAKGPALGGLPATLGGGEAPPSLEVSPERIRQTLAAAGGGITDATKPDGNPGTFDAEAAADVLEQIDQEQP